MGGINAKRQLLIFRVFRAVAAFIIIRYSENGIRSNRQGGNVECSRDNLPMHFPKLCVLLCSVGWGDGANGAVRVVEHLIHTDAAASCRGAVAVKGKRAVVVEQPGVTLEIDNTRMDGEAVFGLSHNLTLEGPGTCDLWSHSIGDGLAAPSA